MSKLKSFYEYTDRREEIKEETQQKKQDMWDYVKEGGFLREEEIKQLKTEDRRIYKEMLKEVQEYAKGVQVYNDNYDNNTRWGIFAAAIGIILIGIVAGIVDESITFICIFVGFSIMMSIGIYDNCRAGTEEYERENKRATEEKEKIVKSYRFAPKNEIQQGKEETMEKWCRRMGWETPEEAITKVYKPKEYKPLEEEE